MLAAVLATVEPRVGEHVDHLKNVAIDRDVRMTAIVTDHDINFTDVDGQN